MSVPIRATAGAAFRRTLPDVMRMRVVYDEKMRRQDCASWWEAHTNLLRRLLAAQPTAEYEKHKFHPNFVREAPAFMPGRDSTNGVAGVVA